MNVFDGIYYPEGDGLPLPDGPEQETAFLTRITPVLRAYLEQYYDVIVTGDTFLYYERGEPSGSGGAGLPRHLRRQLGTTIHPTQFLLHVAPGDRIPDFVLEIGSRKYGAGGPGAESETYTNRWALENTGVTTPLPDSRALRGAAGG